MAGDTAPVSVEEAKEMKRKLDKADLGDEVVCDILNNLLSREVTIKIVVDTGLGIAIKARRKSSNATTQEVANKLYQKWKSLADVVEKASTPKTPTGDKAGMQAPAKKSSNGADKKDGATEAKAEKGNSAVKSDAKSKDKPASSASPASVREESVSSLSGNDKRSKVKDLIVKALASAGGDSNQYEKLATDIEKELYNFFQGTNDKYTAQVKSVTFNLKDPKNPEFRARVISGEVSADMIPKLSSVQMAGKATIEGKKANWDAATFQDKMFLTAQNLGAASDMFQCGKCKKKECSFYQKQTRSADEPMTVFITCKACGHEWRE